MEQSAYVVTATWDDEAKVWVVESDDVPGLVTEARHWRRYRPRFACWFPSFWN
jgi:hypothetical protein